MTSRAITNKPKPVFLIAVVCDLPAACNPQQSNSKLEPIQPDPIQNGLPETIITSLEVAQTHLIPPEGKTWIGNQFAKDNLPLVGNRDALVKFDPNQTINKPMLEALVNGQKLG